MELLYLCRSKDIPVEEVAVKWEDIDGSHINVISASFQMARDMLLIKLLYSLGLWGLGDYNW